MGQPTLSKQFSRWDQRRRTRRVVLIARSARLLAEAAAAVGYRAHAVDTFNDVDTCAASAATTLLQCEEDWQAAHVLARLGDWQGVPVVYGAGLENRIELLEALACAHPLVGNRPAVLANINDPCAWFTALSALGIAHPETRFEAPLTLAIADKAWLSKRARSAGGQHVVWAHDRGPRIDSYWQRYVRGRSCSVWFLADGSNVRIIGGVRHLQLQPTLQWPFRMSGAVRLPLPDSVQQQLQALLKRLTEYFGLCGMNGLDFLLDPNDRVSVVEINARPPSTLALSGARHWFAWHLAACEGRWSHWGQLGSTVGPCAAQAVVYSPYDQAMLHPLPGLDWLHDQSPVGRRVVFGEPCFTVTATAATPLLAVRLLRDRVKQLLRACLQPASV